MLKPYALGLATAFLGGLLLIHIPDAQLKDLTMGFICGFGISMTIAAVAED